jgi:acetyl esterase/lipase
MKFSRALLALFLSGASTLSAQSPAPIKPKAAPSNVVIQSPDVRVESNIDYLSPDRKEQADLYLPKETADGKKHPGIVIIHGGGWSGGVKDATREKNIGTTLALHGYVCLSINYVLADKDSKNVVWPQNLHDCKTAVRWLRKNAERLNLDADNIGTIGGSAGGHLATMVAVTGPDLDPAGPYGEYSTKVQCAVDLYGPADLENWKDIAALRKSRKEDPALYKQFSVLTHLDKDDPPILILHGTADTTVPLSQSETLAAALEKHGIEHHLEIIEGAPHTFHLQPVQKDLRPMVVEFFDKHLKGKSDK